MRPAVNPVATSRGARALFSLEVARPWGVDAVVTGRAGGVSEPPFDSLNLGDHVGDDPARVTENRRRVATAMGVDPPRLVLAHQVHGARVLDVDAWRGEPLEGDALVTTRVDVVLGVLVADCLPVLFVDTAGPRVAVAHAGWRGLESGVLAATLAAFDAPRSVRVVIGPHVSVDAYQVGPEVAGRFAHVDGALRADVADRSRLDLSVVARHQLGQAGLDRAHLTHWGPPTDGANVFFSDRAQRPCGRFGLFARRIVDAPPREGVS